jgi:hypothetical protein
MTPSGIEPATFRFVAQYLNHCATISGPPINSGSKRKRMIIIIIIIIKIILFLLSTTTTQKQWRNGR